MWQSSPPHHAPTLFDGLDERTGKVIRRFDLEDLAVSVDDDGTIWLETGTESPDTYEQTILEPGTAYLLGHALIKLSGI
jgi:hypothetical protein